MNAWTRQQKSNIKISLTKVLEQVEESGKFFVTYLLNQEQTKHYIYNKIPNL